jgi:hypothetical protein
MLPLAAKNLQERLDPKTTGSFDVSPAGTDRLRVHMALSAEGVAAYKEAKDAEAAFEKSILNPDVAANAISLEGEKREAAIDAIAPPSSARNVVLERLGWALDSSREAVAAVQNANQTGEEEEKHLAATTRDLSDAMTAVGRTTLGSEAFGRIISAALARGDEPASQWLERLPADYPEQADAIRRLVAARQKLFQITGQPDGPADIEQLINARGQLEFRIGIASAQLSPLSRAMALQTLVMEGGRKGCLPRSGGGPLVSIVDPG